jgi:hypothetical protein
MKLTTIIPVHEMDDNLSGLLTKALESVVGQDKYNVKELLTILIPVAPSAVEALNVVLSKFSDNLNIKVILNNGNTSFQGQINFASEKVETEYFTILEFDDEVSETYYFNVVKYANYYGNVDIFLPIIIESNEKNQALKLTNETSWSRSFVGENGEVGYLNAESLNQYTDFKICGSIIKTNEFINGGMLKTNIELTFQYEFLLRMIINGSNVYIIPKIGCKHLVTREGSLFDVYSKTFTLKQRKFWFNTAKKEANFTSDREIDTSELLSIAE